MSSLWLLPLLLLVHVVSPATSSQEATPGALQLQQEQTARDWGLSEQVRMQAPTATRLPLTGVRQRHTLQQSGSTAGRVVGWGTIDIPNYVPSDVLQQGATDIGVIQEGLEFLALLTNKSVVVWGYGSAFIPANATANVSAIAAGAATALALLSNGTVVSLNDIPFATSPEKVPQLMQANVAAIWISGDTRCARLHNGSLVVWDVVEDVDYVEVIHAGSGAGAIVTGVAAEYDSSGTNTTIWNSSTSILLTLRANGSVVPVRGLSVVPRVLQSNVVAITGAVTTSSSARHNLMLALLGNGSIVQWSYGARHVRYPLSRTGFNFTSIAAPSFAVTSTGSVVSWDVGSLEDTSKYLPVSVQGGIQSVVCGNIMSLALRKPGPFNVIGFNGTITVFANSSIPAGVSAGVVTQVAAGNHHAIALQVDGRVVVWGDNSLGQLSVPQGLVDVVQVAACSNYCAAVTRQGNLYVWGYGEYPGGTKLTTVPAHAQFGVDKVAAGKLCILVLLRNGLVTGWCDLDPISGGPAHVLDFPLAVSANVSDIAVGEDVAIAVLNNGSIIQWGANSTRPQLENVVSVAVNSYWATAVLQNGSVAVWWITDYSNYPSDICFKQIVHAKRASLSPGDLGEALLLLDNETVVQCPFECDKVCWVDTIPADARSGVIDMAVGHSFWFVLTTNGASASSKGGMVTATSSATISFVMTMSAAHALHVYTALQQQFGQQLKAALVAYFNASGVVLHVTEQVQLTGPQRGAVTIPVNITATWQSGDTTTPAFLQQQVSQLQQHPAAALPRGLVQTYGIETSTVAISQLETSGLPPGLPSPEPNRSLDGLPSPQGESSAASLLHPSTLSAAASVSSKKISRGAVIGITVGCVVGVAAGAAVAIVMYRLWKRHSANSSTFKLHSGSVLGDHVAKAIPEHHVKIVGLPQGELFVLATAQNYSWTEAAALSGPIQAIEAGVNDTKLDKMLQRQQAVNLQQAAAPLYCSAVQLSKDELRQQVQLLSDGLLGRGATALVFKCIWPSRFGPNALLAAKVLQNGFESDTTVLSSFAYEAHLLSGTQHPHVVKLYGYCLDPPTVCLILELLPCSLKDLLYKAPSEAASSAASKARSLSKQDATMPVLSASCAQNNSTPCVSTMVAVASHHVAVEVKTVDAAATDSNIGSIGHLVRPATLPQIVEISTDIAAGLAYLHSQPAPAATADSKEQHLPMAASRDGRIVHRDLKPANILFNSQGVVKISDFGLARQHDHTTFATMNLGAGTLPYMAPELLISSKAGVSGAACTNRVDIYSLGIIMWELLMGQPPWKGMAAASIMAAVTNRRRLPLPGDVQSEDREHAIMDIPLLQSLPAHSHPDLPKMCQIIQACWQHRELRRPTASAVHGMLSALLQQLQQQPISGTQ